MSDYEQAGLFSYVLGEERDDLDNQADKTLQERGTNGKHLRSPNCMFEWVEIAKPRTNVSASNNSVAFCDPQVGGRTEGHISIGNNNQSDTK